MLEHVQPHIIQPHRTTVKYGEVLGLLGRARPNSQYNNSLAEANRLNACLLRIQLGLGPLNLGSYIALQNFCLVVSALARGGMQKLESRSLEIKRSRIRKLKTKRSKIRRS